jgi:DNA processing protein
VLETIRPISGRVAQRVVDYRAERITEDLTDAERSCITNLLGHAPVQVDELMRQSGLTTASVQMVLLELELGGRIERHAGGRVSLI